MAGLLSQVTEGRDTKRPLKVLVYGVPKVGKSTFAAGSPAPIFLDSERGTLNLNVRRLKITDYREIPSVIKELLHGQHTYRTVVLDTLDALERLLVSSICHEAGKSSLDKVGGGYGKGWNRVYEAWGRLFNSLDELCEQRGLNVIALAHSEVQTFKDPEGAEFNRWSMRLNKKSLKAWTGWVEDILFATRIIKTQDQSRQVDQRLSGNHVLYTTWSPGREGGNRRNLPPMLPLSWRAFADALEREIEFDPNTVPLELPEGLVEPGHVQGREDARQVPTDEDQREHQGDGQGEVQVRTETVTGQPNVHYQRELIPSDSRPEKAGPEMDEWAGDTPPPVVPSTPPEEAKSAAKRYPELEAKIAELEELGRARLAGMARDSMTRIESLEMEKKLLRWLDSNIKAAKAGPPLRPVDRDKPVGAARGGFAPARD